MNCTECCQTVGCNCGGTAVSEAFSIIGKLFDRPFGLTLFLLLMLVLSLIVFILSKMGEGGQA